MATLKQAPAIPPEAGGQAYLDTVFAWLAPRYLEQARRLSLGAYDRWLEAVARLAAGEASARIVDIGCGPGRLLQLLRARAPSARLTGLDPVGEVLRLVPSGIETVQDYLESFAPNHAEEFDAATMTFVIRDVVPEQRGAFLSAAARLLRPGGRLIILETHTPQGARALGFSAYVYGWMPQWGRRWLTPDWNPRNGPYPYSWLADTQRRWDRGQDLPRLLHEAGLTALAWHFPPSFPVLLVSARKPD